MVETGITTFHEVDGSFDDLVAISTAINASTRGSVIKMSG
jgi:hypothetical protein